MVASPLPPDRFLPNQRREYVGVPRISPAFLLNRGGRREEANLSFSGFKIFPPLPPPGDEVLFFFLFDGIFSLSMGYAGAPPFNWFENASSGAVHSFPFFFFVSPGSNLPLSWARVFFFSSSGSLFPWASAVSLQSVSAPILRAPLTYSPSFSIPSINTKRFFFVVFFSFMGS